MNETMAKGMIQLPILDTLLTELQKVKDELQEIKQKMAPYQELYDLKEACALKGISYGTLSNMKYKHLQPNGGVPDVLSCGRARWRWVTVQKWLTQSDSDMEKAEAKVK
jgi:hypothetical protein